MGWFGLVKTNKNAGLETPDHRVISKNDRRNRINQGTETNETRIDSDLRNRIEKPTEFNKNCKISVKLRKWN